ncbi:hypothetical protein ACFWA6_17230 [Streptomyces sp. NPDC060020]|uniref:hypothetical protein n=1 Tax=Streptomyces sp. NPDC060020 TaxID=3347038 RepID=UPI0036C62C19
MSPHSEPERVCRGGGRPLEAVRDRLARPEALSGNEPWQLTNLLAGWGAEAAPALPELCAALPYFPGRAARAIVSVAADCAVGPRPRPSPRCGR